MSVEPARVRTNDEIVAAARGIATGQLLIADFSDPDWQIAMALMASALAEIPNLGVVLVPLDAHSGCRWLNGRVPMPVVACEVIPREDIERLQAEYDRMVAVLYPTPDPAEGESNDPA